MRAWALVIAAVLQLVQSAPVFAQANPASGDVGFIGIPEYTSTETGLPFFFKEDADWVDGAYKAMRDAIAKCDLYAYRHAHGGLLTPGAVGPFERDAKTPSEAQRARDRASARQAGLSAPAFPEPCNPPTHQAGDRFHPYNLSLSVLGGGLIPSNSTAYVTGVDTFTPGNFLIDNRSSGNSSTATGLFGTRAQMAVFLIRQAMEKERQPAGFRVFVETGIQTGFGANSFTQSFQGINTVPQGFGQQLVRENLQVPILVGVSIPLAAEIFASASSSARMYYISPPSLDLYGGITLDSWTHSLAGRDGGAPAGPGFNASNNRFTVDPTIGIGLRFPIPGVPNLSIGTNAEVQFRPGSVVQAPSANFPSETYYGTVDPRANFLLMGRIAWSFGSP